MVENLRGFFVECLKRCQVSRTFELINSLKCALPSAWQPPCPLPHEPTTPPTMGCHCQYSSFLDSCCWLWAWRCTDKWPRHYVIVSRCSIVVIITSWLNDTWKRQGSYVVESTQLWGAIPASRFIGFSDERCLILSGSIITMIILLAAITG